MSLEKEKLFYFIALLFLGLASYFLCVKIMASAWEGIQLPIINICLILGILWLYKQGKKNTAVLLLLFQMSLTFTIRPYFLPPIWSSVGFYLNAAFFSIIYFDFSRKQLLLVFAFFLTTSIVNLSISITGPYSGLPPNFQDELIIILASFAPAAYIILSFKHKIKQLSLELSTTDSNLKTVMDNTPSLIYALDKNQRVFIANKAILNFLNLKSNEYKGKTKLEFTHIQDYLQYADTIQEDELILTGKKTLITGQFSFKKSNGQPAHYRYTKVPLLVDKQHIEGVLCVMDDITNLEENKKVLEEKNLELERYIQSNLELESFAYLASHDLKTPLRSLTSFSQLLQKSAKDKLNKTEEEYLGYITSSAKNMNQLITDMLEYSRVKNAAFILGEIQLSDLFSLLEFAFKAPAKELNGTLKFGFKEDYLFEGDFLKIKQLLYNLISNALKYTKKDVAPLIHVYCVKKEHKYIFSVMDNGIGIHEEHHKKIFLLLKRLHTNVTYEGTGIGLAICKSIVEKHNGEIWLESKEGQGSTFYFSISEDLR